METFGDRLRMFADLARSIGPAHAARHKLRHAWHQLTPPRSPYRLTTRSAEFPLWCRPDTSDEIVFFQVFVDRQYEPVAPRDSPRLILDCGANVGYTAAYFLTRFPAAHVVAVEPDPGNAGILRRNLRPYGARATVVETGVWSSPVGLVMSTTPFRDGREWARQVREALPDEAPEMRATDIRTLLAGFPDARVGILKMDIEGAELEVFSGDCSSWIPRVDTFAVEVHSDEAGRAFEHALGRAFEVTRHGELTLAVRKTRD